MELHAEALKRFLVEPGRKCKLKDFDPGWAGDSKVPEAERREYAERMLRESTAAVAQSQELLFASDSWSVLVILQAIDAAGKDGTIKHVMSGVNPQGVNVTSFKVPSTEELDHNFLWRCTKALPERGHIGIFNRSYYEEVLVVKVHQDLVRRQRLPEADPERKKFWNGRYEDINAFERHLTRNGTRIVKCFLHLSKDEQKRRFLERIDTPEKHYKFSATDVQERTHWDEYQKTYAEMLTETSTKWAPWYVIPADNKWVSRAAVAVIVAQAINDLDLKWPRLSEEAQQAMAAAREQLLNEE